MGTRVLVPMDDSKLAERALRHALDVYPDGEITVLHVVGEPSPMMGGATRFAVEEDLEQAAKDHADSLFSRAEEIAAEYDTRVETVVAVGHPARTIVDRADDFDMVVIGSHGGSLVDRLFVGNTAETVFRRSPVPVTVVR